MPQDTFVNEFRATPLLKINFGIQQLYVVGLTDILPLRCVLDILKNHIPYSIYNKLFKYVLRKDHNATISWTQCKSQLDRLDLSKCSTELEDLLTLLTPTDENVKIFHIGSNLAGIVPTEPNHINTEAMILEFITDVYRRNVLASVVKYIILKELINKFTTSLLTPTHKGIFSQILLRLNQIVFECILLSFNGANYDNILLANPLILCLTKLKHNVSIFKKGSSITTIKCTIKNNIQAPLNKKIKRDFSLNLYLKDIRFMVSPSMTLDRIGQLFNIKTKKLAFPYNQAVSIAALMNTYELHPNNKTYWDDTFTGRCVKLEDRLNAQHIFEQQRFDNLYQYSVYYLIQDCLLLHNIVLTIFKTYLNDNNINIFLRRNYTQSHLSFQELFIVQPSRQIVHTLAPKTFTHPFLNYFIKKSTVGGLCTAFVHQQIDENTVINSHFPYVNTNLNKDVWPNFHPAENLVYDKKPAGIVTLDIRSLYPSAACKPIPVNTPLIYTRLTQADYRRFPPNMSVINLKSFCSEVQENGNFHTDYFRLINKGPRFYQEYNAINYYLSLLPKDIDIVRFQSSFTAFGQLYFVQYPVDGFLVYTCNDVLHIRIIQYDSVYKHGHTDNCKIANNADQQLLAEKTALVKTGITDLYLHLIDHFKLKNIIFEYVSISDCQFKSHRIPPQKPYICEHKPTYTYNRFLDNIYDKKLTGYIVLRNLTIKNQNPIFGFLIQKAHYGLKNLSPYTKRLLHHFTPSERVVSLHKSSHFIVISTHYFLWLKDTFGFEHTPDIYHGVFYKFEHYLKDQIESKLLQRMNLKTQIKTETDVMIRQNLEVRSELIKLMLNSCYGFTLCNLSSSKFKSYKNAQTLPRHKRYTKKIKSSIQLAPNVYLQEYYPRITEIFSTTLGHVGANILFFSKLILLKRLYFVLKYLNPSKSQLLYMDTDSAHVAVHCKTFEENIDEPLRSQFARLYKKHFEHSKLSGIWVNEGFFQKAKYIGEKAYVLYNNPSPVSHMKGLNRYFQERFVTDNIDTNLFPHIAYNIFQKTSDFVIYKTSLTKNVFGNYVPIKRYFVCASGSLPLKFND